MRGRPAGMNSLRSPVWLVSPVKMSGGGGAVMVGARGCGGAAGSNSTESTLFKLRLRRWDNDAPRRGPVSRKQE